MTTERGTDQPTEWLKARTLPNIGDVKRHRNAIAAVMRSLTDDELDEAWRKGKEATGPDGYPPASMSAAVHAEDPEALTSVEAAVEARRLAERREQITDMVLTSIAELAAQLSEMVKLARKVDERHQFVRAQGAAARGRQSSVGVCEACGRTVLGTLVDKRKAGFCWRAVRQNPESLDDMGKPGLEESDRSGCYDAWVRWRYRHPELELLSVPERRARFIAERQEMMHTQALEAQRQLPEQGK